MTSKLNLNEQEVVGQGQMEERGSAQRGLNVKGPGGYRSSDVSEAWANVRPCRRAGACGWRPRKNVKTWLCHQGDWKLMTICELLGMTSSVRVTYHLTLTGNFLLSQHFKEIIISQWRLRRQTKERRVFSFSRWGNLRYMEVTGLPRSMRAKVEAEHSAESVTGGEMW